MVLVQCLLSLLCMLLRDIRAFFALGRPFVEAPCMLMLCPWLSMGQTSTVKSACRVALNSGSFRVTDSDTNTVRL